MNCLKTIPLMLIAFTLMTTSFAEADWINLSGAQNAKNLKSAFQ